MANVEMAPMEIEDGKEAGRTELCFKARILHIWSGLTMAGKKTMKMVVGNERTAMRIDLMATGNVDDALWTVLADAQRSQTVATGPVDVYTEPPSKYYRWPVGNDAIDVIGRLAPTGFMQIARKANVQCDDIAVGAVLETLEHVTADECVLNVVAIVVTPFVEQGLSNNGKKMPSKATLMTMGGVVDLAAFDNELTDALRNAVDGAVGRPVLVFDVAYKKKFASGVTFTVSTGVYRIDNAPQPLQDRYDATVVRGTKRRSTAEMPGPSAKRYSLANDDWDRESENDFEDVE